jgi:hypothetical protein
VARCPAFHSSKVLTSIITLWSPIVPAFVVEVLENKVLENILLIKKVIASRAVIKIIAL